MENKSKLCERCQKPIVGNFSSKKKFCWDCTYGTQQRKTTEKNRLARKKKRDLVKLGDELTKECTTCANFFSYSVTNLKRIFRRKCDMCKTKEKKFGWKKKVRDPSRTKLDMLE